MSYPRSMPDLPEVVTRSIVAEVVAGFDLVVSVRARSAAAAAGPCSIHAHDADGNHLARLAITDNRAAALVVLPFALDRARELFDAHARGIDPQTGHRTP